jgi:hypothetical protein
LSPLTTFSNKQKVQLPKDDKITFNNTKKTMNRPKKHKTKNSPLAPSSFDLQFLQITSCHHAKNISKNVPKENIQKHTILNPSPKHSPTMQLTKRCMKITPKST